MRMGIAILGVVVPAVAVAQPQPQPPPSQVPYGAPPPTQPAPQPQPPTTMPPQPGQAPYGAPPPTPAPAPPQPPPPTAPPTYPAQQPTPYPGQPVPGQPQPPTRSRFLFTFGFGLGGVGMKHDDGPCMECSHSPIGLGGHIGGGIEVTPGLGIVADITFAVGFVDGLPGSSGKIQQGGFFVGGKLTPSLGRFSVAASLGYISTDYKYDEPGFFGGSVTHDIHFGSGPALLGVARFELGSTRKLDYGVEARIMGASLEDVGPFSTVMIDAVLGWF